MLDNHPQLTISNDTHFVIRAAKGVLRKVADDVVIEVLRAWESWPGSAAELYRELGLSKMQLVTMIQNLQLLETY